MTDSDGARGDTAATGDGSGPAVRTDGGDDPEPATDGGSDPVAEDEAAAVTAVDESEPLGTLRASGRRRWGVTLAAVVVGVGLAWLHWVGLVVGAALVALPQRSFRLGVAAGVGFGAVVAVANVASLAATGPAAVATAVAMTQVFAVSVAAPLVAGVIGGLVRGVV